MEIDLSEFLAPGTPTRKVRVAPQKPPIPLDHIICAQCSGSGKYVFKETHTPELTEAAENLLLDFGKILPVQTRIETETICKRCSGEGHYKPPQDIRAREVTLFWTETTCRCGLRYEGPAHTNTILVRSDVYSPIVRDYKLFGWRFSESIYQPQALLPMHRTLPMRIETIRNTIEACRRCIREQMIICLPGPVGEA